MANKKVELELVDGTEVTVRPISLYHLNELGEKLEKYEEKSDSDSREFLSYLAGLVLFVFDALGIDNVVGEVEADDSETEQELRVKALSKKIDLPTANRVVLVAQGVTEEQGNHLAAALSGQS